MAKRHKKRAPARPVTCCQLGVLHAFGPGFLHAPNKLLEFKGSDERRLRIHLADLKLVCLYGSVRVTAGAVKLITEAGAALAYLSWNGSRTNGLLQPATDQWRGRRYRQYQAAQDRKWSLEQARQIVMDKLRGQWEAAKHYRRHGRQTEAGRSQLREITNLTTRIRDCGSYDELRGLEGYGSRLWFDTFRQLLPEGWTFPERRKRPPTDPINALLSLGYTILYHRMEAACQAWGLDTALGVFHEDRPGRASLACDLMEPFRAPVVDRLVLSCLGTRQFEPSDFVQREEDQSVQMTEDGWRRWLNALETQLQQQQDDYSSLQTQLVNRVQAYRDALPAWNGTWPSRVPST